MSDQWATFNRSMFNPLPYTMGFIFVTSAVLLVAWLLGLTVAPLRAPIGSALGFRFAPEEGQFLGLMLLGSVAGYASTFCSAPT